MQQQDLITHWVFEHTLLSSWLHLCCCNCFEAVCRITLCAPVLLPASADPLQEYFLTALSSKTAHLFEQLVHPCRLLIERFGYPNTFLITAALKLVAYLPLVPLLAFVDDGVLRIRRSQRQETVDSNLQAPLLS